MRRTRAAVEQLVEQIDYYSRFTNKKGDRLSYNEIALLVGVSKSRVAQLITKLRAQNDRGK